MIISEKKRTIRCPEDIAAIIRAILTAENEIDQMKEHFWVFGINTKNVIQYIELVALGTLTKLEISPREVFRFAISKAVASIVLAHNHPSGDPAPSNEDVAVTDRLVKCGGILAIKVLDHVIVGNRHHSFKENGIIGKE